MVGDRLENLSHDLERGIGGQQDGAESGIVGRDYHSSLE